MKLTVLDTIQEASATCYLCRISLEDYINGIPDDYESYFVQRGIVKNKYLDNLWDTIANSKHIPQIVLLTEKPVEKSGSIITVKSSSIRILDGLQRSKKLSILWNTVKFITSDLKDNKELSEIRVARNNSGKIKSLECDPKTFRNILSTYRENDGNKDHLINLFSHNFLWVEIWTGLNQDAQIKKMLILNAGHKSVNIKHQIELLFFNYFGILEHSLNGIKIIREKEQSAISYSKNREIDSFHFAHLISAFESLNQGKAVTTNSDFSAEKSFEEPDSDDIEFNTVNTETIRYFSETLLRLNNKLSSPEGIRWLGREVVLVGIFGGIGAYAQQQLEGDTISALQSFDSRIDEFAATISLSKFEKARNSLELSKVNIGNVNKRAVFQATIEFLENSSAQPFDWLRHFRAQTPRTEGEAT